MKELAVLLERIGCRSVKTYIQSGNVVFKSSSGVQKLKTRIVQEIKHHHGFEPKLLLLTVSELQAAIVANPFPEAESDPKGLHFGFLESSPPHPNLVKLKSIKAKTERFRLIDRVFYLHAPDGVGRSKLAANSEKLLGVSMTDRNWRTVCKIFKMSKESVGELE